MREIKFRTWDKRNNRMIKNEDILRIYMRFREIDYMLAGEVFSITFEEAEIQQCTGLKDKNGTEIYEGDILYDRTYNLLFTVIFDDGVFCANYAGWAYKPLCSSCAYSKIVDNIYENPELLNN